MRSDELRWITVWMWENRPDLAKQDWQPHADRLEAHLAVMAWRWGRSLEERAVLLCDALDVEALRGVSEVGATRRGWASDESTADPAEWGPCG